MAISSSLVGIAVTGVELPVDERWTMAYAASIDDYLPAYLDTTRDGGIVAHPLFVVCQEWPVIVESRAETEARGLTAAEVLTSVHATHDTTIHRLIRPGDRLTTTLELVGLEQIRPGVKSTLRLRTVDQTGAVVATTTQDGIYLGQQSVDEDRPDTSRPTPLLATRTGTPQDITIEIAQGAAHTYTECARIWNPIHTSKAVALASGLPDIILHGTANLAHGVSAVVARAAGGRPELVRRVSCRFAAMVRLPSTITVRIWDAVPTEGEGSVVPFHVLNGDGEPAVDDGMVLLAEPGSAPADQL